ncbi:MAG TPA: TrkA family potassium uptake protein [Saprospiraceae bacterium]|nr:TrkA family potassium uptake protein [Saprospiraceae bacterium]
MPNMKIIVVGLGNFGSSLSTSLMDEGHEVIGVDNNLDRVERMKDILTYAIKLDATELSAIKTIPFDVADLVIIAIGEDVGASITALAQIKKIFDGKIIARSINEIHHAILETIKIDEIVEPEAEFATELAKRIALRKIIKSMNLPGAYEIAEIPIPSFLVGVAYKDLSAKLTSGVQVITTIKKRLKENIFKASTTELVTQGTLPPDYIFDEEDIVLLFGTNKDIEKFANG